MARVVKVSRGVAMPYLRRLYTVVALPKIMYAADIFLNPAKNRKKGDRNMRGGKAVINRLAAIQRRAAIMITGAMRTTAADTAEAHANLLPMRVLIDRYRARAALRLATLPPMHPLHRHVKRAARHKV
jgi:hypothetical protein